jgi:hypothetical protein
MNLVVHDTDADLGETPGDALDSCGQVPMFDAG